MWEKLLYFDRRIIFLLIGAAVLVPFLTQWMLPQGKITATTQNLFDAIEALAPGTPVLISFDYGPSSMPEIQPMALALAHHILSRDLRLVASDRSEWPRSSSTHTHEGRPALCCLLGPRENDLRLEEPLPARASLDENFEKQF